MSAIVEHGRLFGTVVEQWGVDGILFCETEHDARASPRQARDAPNLCLVLEGGVVNRVAGTFRELRAGGLVVHPVNIHHGRVVPGVTTRCLSIYIDAAWVQDDYELDLRLLDVPMHLEGTRANWGAVHIYRLLRKHGSGSDESVTQLTIGLLDEVMRERRVRTCRAPRWLKEARELLHESYAGRVSLATLSATVGVHPVHLSRTFHRHVGSTVTEYVLNLRVAYAARALVESQDSLAGIAYQAGFADQGHFTRRFKEITGFTPGSYRRALAPRSAHSFVGG